MRIVVCDDHGVLLEALCAALAGRGYIVEAAATTPADAAHAVARHDPDLLLIDVCFPDGSGLDVARRVVEHHSRTKVVILTGSDALEPLLEALEIGVSGYTRKDQRIDGIAQVLERATRGEVAVDQAMMHRLSRAGTQETRPSTPFERLTAREREVLRLLVDGLTTSEIVAALDITQSTARSHVQSILSKFGVHSRLHAVVVADEAYVQADGHQEAAGMPFGSHARAG